MTREEFDRAVGVQVSTEDDGTTVIAATVGLKSEARVPVKALVAAEDPGQLKRELTGRVLTGLRHHALDAEGRAALLQAFSPLYARLRLILPVGTPQSVFDGLHQFAAQLGAYVQEAA